MSSLAASISSQSIILEILAIHTSLDKSTLYRLRLVVDSAALKEFKDKPEGRQFACREQYLPLGPSGRLWNPHDTQDAPEGPLLARQ
jgi:hypothetical protein